MIQPHTSEIMKSPWDAIRESINGQPRAAVSPAPHHNQVQRWTPKPFATIPHAILDSSRRVMAIRNYPRTTRSNNVVPLEEGSLCAIGWFWNGSEFQKEDPNV